MLFALSVPFVSTHFKVLILHLPSYHIHLLIVVLVHMGVLRVRIHLLGMRELIHGCTLE